MKNLKLGWRPSAQPPFQKFNFGNSSLKKCKSRYQTFLVLPNFTGFLYSFTIYFVRDRKIQIEISDKKWFHLYLLSGIYIRLSACVVSVCRDLFWTHSAFKIDLFAEKVNRFKTMLLTIFAKGSIVDVWKALNTSVACSNGID